MTSGGGNKLREVCIGQNGGGKWRNFTAMDTFSSGGLMATGIGMDTDGAAQVVVARAYADGSMGGDAVGLYRLPLDASGERTAQFSAFNGTGTPDEDGFVVGDVDASRPGPELVIAEAVTGHATARVRVFGDLATSRPRLLYTLRSLPNSATVSGPISVVIGDVVSGSGSPGLEIVVGDRRGRVCVYNVGRGRVNLLRCSAVFPDSPRTSALQLAAGNVLPGSADAEILVADDGTRGDAIVRVVAGRTGAILQDFRAFAGAQTVPLQLWIGDVLPGLAGPEVIVGGGPRGGSLRVFSFASGKARLVSDLPDPFGRGAVSRQLLTIGDFLPEAPGPEVAVAQSDATVPVEVYSFQGSTPQLSASVDVSDVGSTVESMLTVR